MCDGVGFVSGLSGLSGCGCVIFCLYNIVVGCVVGVGVAVAIIVSGGGGFGGGDGGSNGGCGCWW